MKFTENEMVFFNSITPGDNLLGFPIELNVSTTIDNALSDTIKSLIAKGVLDSEDKLSKKGALPAKAIDDYKNAKKHVIINKLHIALLEKESVVIIALPNGEYDVMRMPNASILYFLLDKYKELCVKSEDIIEHDEKIEINEFFEQYEELVDLRSLVVGTYEEKKPIKGYVFYWDKGEAYRYDLIKKNHSKINPVLVRHEICDALCVTKEMM